MQRDVQFPLTKMGRINIGKLKIAFQDSQEEKPNVVIFRIINQGLLLNLFIELLFCEEYAWG